MSHIYFDMWQRLSNDKLNATNQEQFLKDLIIEHHQKTQSPLAKKIVSDWSSWKNLFKIVVPPSEKNKLGIEEALEKATL